MVADQLTCHSFTFVPPSALDNGSSWEQPRTFISVMLDAFDLAPAQAGQKMPEPSTAGYGMGIAGAGSPLKLVITPR